MSFRDSKSEKGQLSSWAQTTLGRVADVIMGQSPPSSDLSESQSGVPFLQGSAEFTALNPRSRLTVVRPYRMVKNGDVLMSVRAPVGDMNLADQDYCIGRGLCGIRFSSALNSTFGWYLLWEARRQLRRVAQGSTFEAVGRDDVQDIRLNCPSDIDEQEAIGNVLQACDNEIALTTAIIYKLERIKHGFMQDLLTKGIDEQGDIRSEKTHKFKDSPIGRIPAEWKVGALSDLVDDVKRSVAPFRFPYEEFEYYSIPAYQQHGRPTITLGQEILSQKNLVDDETILFGALNPRVSKVWLVSSSTTRRKIATSEFIALATKAENRSRFIYYLCWSDFVLAPSKVMVKGSTPSRERVDRALFFALPVPIISPAEQDRILSALDGLSEAVEGESNHLDKLTLVKKGLSQDLLSGKVRVKPLMNSM